MISSKYLNAIVAVVIGFAMIFTGILIFIPDVLGIKEKDSNTTSFEYETELFNKNKIINLDISIDKDDWSEMLENALAEEYISCDVIVNGKAFKNVAIRPKGNTSLTSVANDDTTDRYSFKIEFDHYVSNQTCYGLDKLILNNNISDATYMKEYLSYDLMSYMSLSAPLHNYVNVTVNGESWGLYLEIEAMEESYAERNFGSNYGKLYKPESVGAGAQKENNGGGGVPLENSNDGDNQQQNNNNKDGMTNNGLGMGGMSSGGTD
ncbi:CotH kinase family protein [Clostridium bornimense]|uniref:CotH kinase family protein n=1 Tax=Clostridium bornimense TaxID=1216932 RepID=UPI001C1295BE|nr:CotH kinase family protein [Clostridium bornimense]MBU5316334.1 CotH kinase family protein [Clostridium bornimense]